MTVGWEWGCEWIGERRRLEKNTLLGRSRSAVGVGRVGWGYLCPCARLHSYLSFCIIIRERVLDAA